MISYAFLTNSAINAKNIIVHPMPKIVFCTHFYWRIATISNTCQSPGLNNLYSLYSVFYLWGCLALVEKSCKHTTNTQYKSKLPSLNLVLFAELCIYIYLIYIVLVQKQIYKDGQSRLFH